MLLLAGSLSLAVLTLAWPRARLVGLGILIVLTGWTNHALRTAILSPHDLRRILGEQPEIVTLRGMLRETPTQRVYERNQQESWRTMARIDVTALRRNRQPWQPAAGRMAVTTQGILSTNIFVGQEVEITGVAGPPRVAVAEGMFDYRAYLKQQGIYYQLQAASEQDWRVVASPSKPPLADRFREWAREALALGLPAEDESLRLEWALTLGWKTALTEEVSEPFVQAATYHIFAVDGLRMAIVFGIFFYLLRAFGLPRAVCGLVLLPLIWFYTGLTGWPASAIRATVMLSVVIIGWVLRRPSDLINSLFAAALIILTWEPRQLFQAGFQLSFFVVLCIILILPAMREWGRRLTAPDPLLPEELRPRWRQVAASARGVPWRPVAHLARGVDRLPAVGRILLSHHHSRQRTGQCARRAALRAGADQQPGQPVAGRLVSCRRRALQLCRLVSDGMHPGQQPLVRALAGRLFLCLGADSFYHRPVLRNSAGPADRVAIPAQTARLEDRRARARSYASGAGSSGKQRSVTRLTTLPLNGGMAIYFDAPGRADDLLIDCGATNSVQSVTKPFLRAQGVNRLPALVLTHGDLRHVGGAELVASLFSVGKLCVSPVRFRSPVYRRILQDYSRTPEKLRTVSRDDQLGCWTVLHPDPDDRFPQADDNALVLSAVIGGQRVLLLSDLGRPGQDALLQRRPDLRADIVVTGQPVQFEAIGDALLDTLQPRLIIVADSDFPAAERAKPRLQERLARRQSAGHLHAREPGPPRSNGMARNGNCGP